MFKMFSSDNKSLLLVSSIIILFLLISTNCQEQDQIEAETAEHQINQKVAIFCGGCFWGVEYHLLRMAGVMETKVGYIGGKEENPTYQQVKAHETEHCEGVYILYDENQISFESLAKMFFEIHDPTQLNKQGVDIGLQYRSEIFYQDEDQKQTLEKLINDLKFKGYQVVTKLTDGTNHKFWDAEEYHQKYLDQRQETPECHSYVKRFV